MMDMTHSEVLSRAQRGEVAPRFDIGDFPPLGGGVQGQGLGGEKAVRGLGTRMGVAMGMGVAGGHGGVFQGGARGDGGYMVPGVNDVKQSMGGAMSMGRPQPMDSGEGAWWQLNLEDGQQGAAEMKGDAGRGAQQLPYQVPEQFLQNREEFPALGAPQGPRSQRTQPRMPASGAAMMGVQQMGGAVPPQSVGESKRGVPRSGVGAGSGAGGAMAIGVGVSRGAAALSTRPAAKPPVAGQQKFPQQAAARRPPQQQQQPQQQPRQQSAADEYGLQGLLARIKSSQTHNLALGEDLNHLGIDVGGKDVRYATFAYPCAENAMRTEPDYVLPLCYYRKPPALKTSHLSRFELTTLFYIFYNMPKDTLQVYAAKELYERDWRYHMQYRLWFTRSNEQLGYERGTVLYFDITSWERSVYKGPPLDNLHFMTKRDFLPQ